MELNEQTNLTTLCRICMKDTVSVGAQDIYEYEPSDSNQHNLHEMLGAICAPVFADVDIQEQKSRESYGMPKTACPACIHNVVAAYKLHETCIDTDRKLWEMIMLKQNMKVEEIFFVEPKVEPQCEVDSLPAEMVETVLDQDADTKTTDKHKKSKGTSKKQVAESGTNNSGKPFYAPNDVKGGKCDLCPEVIRYKSAMKIHMKSAHPNDIYTCVMCEDVFFTAAQYEQHKLFHKTGRKYGCLECEKRFATRGGMVYHSRLHGKDCLFKCTECNNGFTNISTLKLHFRTHTGEKPFACKQCPARFAQKKTMKLHMSTHNKQQNYVCAICGSRFTREDSLVKHNRIHTGERPYECDQCDKKFVCSDKLKRHQRTHTGEKPYKCVYCDRAFAQSNDLVKHSRSHVGDNPYKCDYCESSFRLLSELRNHYKVHFQPGDEGEGSAMRELESQHSTNGTDSLRFTSAYMLNRRYKQEQEQEQQKKKAKKSERPFECDQCDKKFVDSGKLKRHQRTHTGEKPYKCVYCDRAFAQSNDLVKHSRSHVGDNPYKCDYCESSFRLLSELRNHYKVHFQPGDEGEGRAMQELESQHSTNGSDTLKFTSAYMLNRRYKQEQEREQQKKAMKSKKNVEDTSI